jgi:hypothetical protein
LKTTRLKLKRRKNAKDRLLLDSPERKYVRSIQPAPPGEKGVQSTEGWRAWLPIFTLSSHKIVLTQEPAQAVALK